MLFFVGVAILWNNFPSGARRLSNSRAAYKAFINRRFAGNAFAAANLPSYETRRVRQTALQKVVHDAV
jgi:hypothetical protein